MRIRYTKVKVDPAENEDVDRLLQTEETKTAGAEQLFEICDVENKVEKLFWVAHKKYKKKWERKWQHISNQ